MTNEENVSTRPKIVDGVIVVLILYIAFAVFGTKPYAILKAKNPNNLVQGCLYTHTSGVNIDGFKTSFRKVSISQFPASKKYHLIFQNNPAQNPNQCHKLTYIKVFAGYRTIHFPYDFVDY